MAIGFIGSGSVSAANMVLRMGGAAHARMGDAAAAARGHLDGPAFAKVLIENGKLS